MKRRRFITVSSRKAWLEGHWDCAEWRVVDREDSNNIISKGFRTRREACQWRDQHKTATEARK